MKSSIPREFVNLAHHTLLLINKEITVSNQHVPLDKRSHVMVDVKHAQTTSKPHKIENNVKEKFVKIMKLLPKMHLAKFAQNLQ